MYFTGLPPIFSVSSVYPVPPKADLKACATNGRPEGLRYERQA
jgi:hypothetical protein